MEPAFDENTAYHEAGHAVMALSLDRPVVHVSIRAGREFLGTCQFGKSVFRPSEDWLEREILIALAGLAAEAIHTCRYGWQGASRDLVYAEQLALQRAGHPRQTQRLLRRYLAKTEYLLGREGTWAAVKCIAAELVRLGEISGRTAKALYAESLRKRS